MIENSEKVSEQELREEFISHEVETDHYQRTAMFREQAEKNVEAFQEKQYWSLVEAEEDRLREAAIEEYIRKVEAGERERLGFCESV